MSGGNAQNVGNDDYVCDDDDDKQNIIYFQYATLLENIFLKLTAFKSSLLNAP